MPECMLCSKAPRCKLFNQTWNEALELFPMTTPDFGGNRKSFVNNAVKDCKGYTELR